MRPSDNTAVKTIWLPSHPDDLDYMGNKIFAILNSRVVCVVEPAVERRKSIQSDIDLSNNLVRE